MGNLRAYEGKREATQFKASGEEPLTAKLDIRLTETMKQELKASPGWQGKLRDAIAQLIEAEQCKEM
jgi:hypothetical protein